MHTPLSYVRLQVRRSFETRNGYRILLWLNRCCNLCRNSSKQNTYRIDAPPVELTVTLSFLMVTTRVAAVSRDPDDENAPFNGFER
jgi:hypothetical protein